MSKDWDQFFSENPAPANFNLSEEKMEHSDETGGLLRNFD